MEHQEKGMSREMLKFALQSRDPLELPWPVDESGEPEAPAWLVNVGGNQMDFELTAAMLRSFGVPVLRVYPQGRLSLRVVMGFTGGGMDLYVPRSLLEDARQLLAGGGEIAEEVGQ